MPVLMRAIVVWHFKGDELRGETMFLHNASQVGPSIDFPHRLHAAIVDA
jgi:hypothetical protein